MNNEEIERISNDPNFTIKSIDRQIHEWRVDIDYETRNIKTILYLIVFLNIILILVVL